MEITAEGFTPPPTHKRSKSLGAHPDVKFQSRNRIILFYHPMQIASQSIYLFCLLTNIQLDLKVIDVFSIDRNQEFLKISPQKKLPVLLDNEIILTNSPSILRHLASKFPVSNNWYPIHDAKKFKIIEHFLDQFWPRFSRVTYELFRIEVGFPLGLYSKQYWQQPTSQERKSLLKSFSQCLDELDKYLSENEFICGDEPSIADVLASTAHTRKKFFSQHFYHYTNISRWKHRFKKFCGPHWESVHKESRVFINLIKFDIRAEQPEIELNVIIPHPPNEVFVQLTHPITIQENISESRTLFMVQDRILIQLWTYKDSSITSTIKIDIENVENNTKLTLKQFNPPPKSTEEISKKWKNFFLKNFQAECVTDFQHSFYFPFNQRETYSLINFNLFYKMITSKQKPTSLDQQTVGTSFKLLKRIYGTIIQLDPEKRIVIRWRSKNWSETHFAVTNIEIFELSHGSRVEVFYSLVPKGDNKEFSEFWIKVWKSMKALQVGDLEEILVISSPVPQVRELLKKSSLKELKLELIEDSQRRIIFHVSQVGWLPHLPSIVKYEFNQVGITTTEIFFKHLLFPLESTKTIERIWFKNFENWKGVVVTENFRNVYFDLEPEKAYDLLIDFGHIGILESSDYFFSEEKRRFRIFKGELEGMIDHLEPKKQFVCRFRLSSYPLNHYATIQFDVNPAEDGTRILIHQKRIPKQNLKPTLHFWGDLLKKLHKLYSIQQFTQEIPPKNQKETSTLKKKLRSLSLDLQDKFKFFQ